MTLCVCPFVAGKEPSPAGKDYYFSRSCGLDPYACGHESHALSTCCFVFTGAEEVMGRRQQQQQPHGNDDPSGLCMAHMGLDRWSLGAQSMFLGSSSSWEGHPPITHPPHVCPPVLDGPAWLTWPVCVCVPCAEQEDDQLRHEDDGDDGDSSGKRGCHIVWGGGLVAWRAEHGMRMAACACASSSWPNHSHARIWRAEDEEEMQEEEMQEEDDDDEYDPGKKKGGGGGVIVIFCMASMRLLCV